MTNTTKKLGWSSLDWDATDGHIPPGAYEFRVHGVELKMSQAGNEMLDVTCIGRSGKAEGMRFHVYLVRLPTCMWKTRSFLEAVQVPVGDFHFQDLIDRQFMGVVADDTYK